jgi:hypothetical protein
MGFRSLALWLNVEKYLTSNKYKIKARLVTAEYGAEGIKYKLCSVLTEEKGSLNFFNVGFVRIIRSKKVVGIHNVIFSFNWVQNFVLY